MTRVKRGNVARKRRKKVLKRCSGFRASLSKLYRPAHQAYIHALSYKYRDRRNRKRTFRQLWIARINASLVEFNTSYNTFIHQLKLKESKLNRKIISSISIESPTAFKQLVSFTQK